MNCTVRMLLKSAITLKQMLLCGHNFNQLSAVMSCAEGLHLILFDSIHTRTGLSMLDFVGFSPSDICYSWRVYISSVL